MPRTVCNVCRYHKGTSRTAGPSVFFVSPTHPLQPLSLSLDRKTSCQRGPTWIRGLERAACLTHPDRTEVQRNILNHNHTPPPLLVKRPASPCRAVVALMRLVAPLSAGPPRTQHNSAASWGGGVMFFVVGGGGTLVFLSVCGKWSCLWVGRNVYLFIWYGVRVALVLLSR